MDSLFRPKTTTTRPLSRSDAAVVAFRYWVMGGVADEQRGITPARRRAQVGADVDPLHAQRGVPRRLPSDQSLRASGASAHFTQAAPHNWRSGSTSDHQICNYRR